MWYLKNAYFVCFHPKSEWVGSKLKHTKPPADKLYFLSGFNDAEIIMNESAREDEEKPKRDKKWIKFLPTNSKHHSNQHRLIITIIFKAHRQIHVTETAKRKQTRLKDMKRNFMRWLEEHQIEFSYVSFECLHFHWNTFVKWARAQMKWIMKCEHRFGKVKIYAPKLNIQIFSNHWLQYLRVYWLSEKRQLRARAFGRFHFCTSIFVTI